MSPYYDLIIDWIQPYLYSIIYFIALCDYPMILGIISFILSINYPIKMEANHYLRGGKQRDHDVPEATYNEL